MHVDPIADNIFDAVGSDVTAKGLVETRPTTNDDWAKVKIGAVTLAEGSNLLKMPRPHCASGRQEQQRWSQRAGTVTRTDPGEGRPGQVPWNKHADELRDAGLR